MNDAESSTTRREDDVREVISITLPLWAWTWLAGFITASAPADADAYVLRSLKGQIADALGVE